MIETNIKSILKIIGEDIDREGLKDTPNRVARMYREIFEGYEEKLRITTFDNPNINQMIIKKDIEFYSMCEHHIIPFFGKCSVGYIPKKTIIGISKIARVVDHFSKRLQLQEKLCEQIADYLMINLNPKGVMIIMEAQHLCEMMRGVEKQNSKMITSSIRGVFKKPEVREEFLALIK